MSKPDWESLQIKVIRTLFLAVSSVFVAFYGCYDAAIASDYLEETTLSLQAETTADPVEKILPIEKNAAAVPLAETVSLAAVVQGNPAQQPVPTLAHLLATLPETQPVAAVSAAVETTDAAAVSPVFESGSGSGFGSGSGSERLVVESASTAAVEISQVEDSIPVEVASTPTAELEIPSRFGAQFSTSTAGFDDIIGVDAFVPLDQTAGEEVTFLEGSVQLTGGNLGLSLSVGHRNYDLEDDVLNGGYLGVDSRSTDNSTFYQLAGGYEYIEEDWEWRVNGYLPIGNDRNTIRAFNDDSNVMATSAFQGNQLVLSAVGERQRILQQENALGGLDLEVGAQLDEWDGGELMGYAGAYYLSGAESSLGAQARLLANFESSFNAGLSLQHDGLFGTSVGFSISASLPGIRFHEDDERTFQEENEVAIRLRDPIVRRPTVAVNAINESERIAVDETRPLRNPEEEEDYRFVHVDLAQGAGAGDGTYESPFGAVEDAIALINTDANTYSDGNTIVYVDGERALATTIPGFAVPDRVRVLSQGPAQTIGGMAFPGFPSTPTRLPFSSDQNFNVASNAPNANGITVALPDSNDGVFPTITGGAANLVTLGESTVLSGFVISNAANHGVTANNVNNVELRNNLIENAGGSGVAFDNVGGSIVLLDNEINNSGDRGIQVQNSLTMQSPEVTIAGFDLNGNAVGMEFLARGTDTERPGQRVVIGPSTAANTSVGTPNGTALTNSVLNSAGDGIVAEATGSATLLTSSASQEIAINDVTVDMSGGDGVRLLTRNGAASQEFAMTGGTVSNSTGNGFTFVNGEANNGLVRSASSQEIVVRGVTISGNGGNGVDVALSDAGAQELVIRGNQITNNTGDGIRSMTQDFGIQEWRTDPATGDAGVSENTISGNGGQAVVIEVQDSATLPIVSVVNNTLSGNTTGPDIAITSTSTPGASAAACLIVSDNLAPMGIEIAGVARQPGNMPSVLVQDLAALQTDINITFFAVDPLTGARTLSPAPFQNESNRCIP
ncbi:MAG: right-handed parallel beta-helix repeat-containing protein [Cyanobacteria bacterium J06627_28]